MCMHGLQLLDHLLIYFMLHTMYKACRCCRLTYWCLGLTWQSLLVLQVKGYLKALPGATNFIATEDSLAVALWQLLPQETPQNEFWAGWTRILRVPLKLWRSLFNLELQYERAHARVAAAHGSYYYLSFIGTHPDARSKGYGSLLLRHITQRADAEGRYCLLEATSDRSRSLYERHGFVTYETYHVTSKAPPVFFMIRAPYTSAAARQQQQSVLSCSSKKHMAGQPNNSLDLKSNDTIPALHMSDTAHDSSSSDMTMTIISSSNSSDHEAAYTKSDADRAISLIVINITAACSITAATQPTTPHAECLADGVLTAPASTPAAA